MRAERGPLEVAVRAVPLCLALLLAGCSADPTGTGPARVETGASPPATSAPASSAPASSGPVTPRAVSAVAVYWLGGNDPRGPRLYREFVRRPVAQEPVRLAVEVMLTTGPQDPDYRTLWAKGTAVRDVRREGTTAVVDLTEQARTSGGGSAFEAATVQQLVHTVTAADPTVQAVRVLVEGEPVETLWGAADLSEPVRRGPAAEVLGPVWLDVAEGAVVRRTFGGTASVFEATVSWQVRQGDRVVQEGFSTASDGAPGRGEWSGELDVPPGSYELWAFESSAKDGSVTWLDTKQIRVTR